MDSSTYTSNSKLTLKSLMPNALKREKAEYTTTKGDTFTAPIYNTFLFKKEIIVLLLYFAKMGVSNTMNYFKVSPIIKFVEMDKGGKDYYYFRINKALFIRVDKYFFDKHAYVQSIVYMTLKCCTNRTTMENIKTRTFWLEKLGKAISSATTSKNNFMEKGNNALLHYSRLLDNTTCETLKVHDTHKQDIFSAVRWMIQNFNELRKKENMDLANKRLRCNEYIAALLTIFLNERANRINALLKNQMSLKKVKEIFAFKGDVLISQMFKSGILRYDDAKNDMTFWNLLKFTLNNIGAMVSNYRKQTSLIAGNSI